MKKITAIILSVIMLLSLSVSVMAKYEIEYLDTMVKYDLSCNDEHSITVPSGTEITVVCTLYNVTDENGNIDITSFSHDIYYDYKFFELVDGSLEKLENKNGVMVPETSKVAGELGDHIIQFNGYFDKPKAFESGAIISRFKLKVLADSGSSTVSIRESTCFYGLKSYQMTSQDLTVFVGEEPSEVYTVTYTNNGSTYKTTEAFGDIVIDEAPQPVPQGYEFLGWECNGQVYQPGDTFNVADNVEFVAKWKEIVPVYYYTLTFVTNGGTAVEKVTAVNNTVIDLSSPEYTTNKTGFLFDGWYSDSDLTQKVTSVTLDGSKTVYAKWTEAVKPTYKLTFVTNGGSSYSPLTKEEGTVVDLSAYNPVKSGYTFKGWYSDSALTQAVTSVTLNADTTVYAKWASSSAGNNGGGGGGGGGGGAATVKEYTITFKNTDDTETTVDAVKANENTVVDLSKYIPVKDGYVFGGWYTDKELTDKIAEIKLTKDTTLYAKWVVSDDKPVVEKPDYKPEILTDEHYAYIVGREGGMIVPESDITRAEVATIIYRLLDEDERNKAKTKENVFTDVNENDWFNTAVSTLASLELVNGRTDDTFAPNAPITRAELATIFARMVEVEYDGKVLFSDVSGHWAESYINEAATAEWIVGYNGLFRPNDNITRAEVMTLVNRVLNREPESKADLLDGMTTWKDNADENAWYYLAVQEATNSHTYEMKADGKHEKWTSLTENPDWSKIED